MGELLQQRIGWLAVFVLAVCVLSSNRTVACLGGRFNLFFGGLKKNIYDLVRRKGNAHDRFPGPPRLVGGREEGTVPMTLFRASETGGREEGQHP